MRTTLLRALAVLPFCGITPVLAQQAPVTVLPEVTVSATRVEHESFDLPVDSGPMRQTRFTK